MLKLDTILIIYICINFFLNTRYFIFITFNGSAYHGWQIQKNSVSVQGIINKVFSDILRENIFVTGACRTDTGVHASYFCGHLDSSHNDLDKNENLSDKINSYLPRDIALNKIMKVRNDAHARFSAISRTYNYFIIRKKDPFKIETAWYFPHKIDIVMMNQACSVLMQQSDFTSFAKLHSNTKTNICKIFSAQWHEERNLIVFTIKADRFLRNMVRAIVGTMIETGTGKITIKEFEEIIELHNRCGAGKSAPAEGLFLTYIEYPEDIFI